MSVPVPCSPAGSILEEIEHIFDGLTSFLEYELCDGFIHNWLVAGPLETPVTDLLTVAWANPGRSCASFVMHSGRVSRHLWAPS